LGCKHLDKRANMALDETSIIAFHWQNVLMSHENLLMSHSLMLLVPFTLADVT